MIPQLCYSGLGGEKPKGTRRCPLRRSLGEYSHSMGNLTYVPTTSTAEDIVDELAVLLTSGRLQDSHRQRILQEIEPFEFHNPEKALRLAQQLVVSTPEFHVTNSVRSSGKGHTLESPSTEKSDDEYKVVIYLMLTGGMDSFNLSCLPLFVSGMGMIVSSNPNSCRARRRKGDMCRRIHLATEHNCARSAQSAAVFP